MKKALKRMLFTLIYLGLGYLAAFPLSFYFQGELFDHMNLQQYMDGGRRALLDLAQFGAWDVYRYTLVGSVLFFLIIGRTMEYYFFRKKSH